MICSPQDEFDRFLVPTFCVGMHTGLAAGNQASFLLLGFQVLWVVPTHQQALYLWLAMHSHAERGNEVSGELCSNLSTWEQGIDTVFVDGKDRRLLGPRVPLNGEPTFMAAKIPKIFGLV